MTTASKKRFIFISAILAIALTLLLFGALKCASLSPAMCADTPALSQEENQAIKALMLDAVEAKYLLFSSTGAAELYTEEAMNNPVFPWSANEITNGKGIICSVNGDFMSTVEKTGSGDYQGIITINTLAETCYWHFTVSVVDGQYRISSLGLDI